MSRLRIALTLSGAVSLGAYEGGVLAALLVALGRLREQDPDVVVIDAIAGASAGSMTGVLTARALLTQDDPVRLMHSAWVETPSLENLHAHGPGRDPHRNWAARQEARCDRCDFAASDPS